MECACVYVDTDSGPESSWTATRTARKEHKCCECKRIIKAGEKYEVTSGVWEGTFETFKTCSECVSIRDTFFCDGWEFRSVIPMLKEHIRELGGSISSSKMDDLTPKAKEKAIAILDDVIQDMIEDEGD